MNILFCSSGVAIKYLVRSGWFSSESQRLNVESMVLIPDDFLGVYKSELESANLKVVAYDPTNVVDYLKSNIFARFTKRIFYYVDYHTETNPSSKIHLDIYLEDIRSQRNFLHRIFAVAIQTTVFLGRQARWIVSGLRLLDGFFCSPKLFGLNELVFDSRSSCVTVCSLGNLGNGIDAFVIKEAKKANIFTRAVVIGWDNSSSKGVAVTEPSEVLVWSKIMALEVARIMHVRNSQIKVIANPYLLTFQKLGLRTRQIGSVTTIFLALRSPNTYSGNLELCESVFEGAVEAFEGKFRLIIRPHPNFFRPNRLGQLEHITLYNRIVNFVSNDQRMEILECRSGHLMPGDFCDQEMFEFQRALRSSHILVNSFSTIVFEAFLCGLAVLNIEFNADDGANRFKERQDIQHDMQFLHNQRAVKFGVFERVGKRADLVDALQVVSAPGYFDRRSEHVVRFLAEEAGLET